MPDSKILICLLSVYILIGIFTAIRYSRAFCEVCMNHGIPRRVTIMASITLSVINFVAWPIMYIIIFIGTVRDRFRAAPETDEEDTAEEKVPETITPYQFIVKFHDILYAYNVRGFLNTPVENIAGDRMLDMTRAIGAIQIAYGQVNGVMDDDDERKIKEIIAFVGVMEELFESAAGIPKDLRRNAKGIDPMEDVDVSTMYSPYHMGYNVMRKPDQKDILELSFIMAHAKAILDYRG